MTTCFSAAPGIDVITTTAALPALGSLAINAFVLHGSEPILVDTGTVAGSADFLTALETVIDPAALRWIWLTHTDFDHIGSMAALMAAEPSHPGPDIVHRSRRHRVVVDAASLGSCPPGQSWPDGQRRRPSANRLPAARVRQSGDRRVSRRPNRAMFSSDCFGALLPSVPENAADLDLDELRFGQARWATIDSPWVHDVDRRAFSAKLAGVRAIEPSLVCSSHLPPAPGSMLGVLVDALAAAPDAQPFEGPDQAALEAMLSGMAPVA